MILKCMEHEITKIHTIFFVCSFNAGIHKQDLDAFAQFLSLFSGAEESIAMLITHAERYSQQRKEQICSDILEHKALSEFAKTIQNKIFFAGAMSLSDYDNGLTASVQHDCINVMRMRKDLYQHIFQNEQFCQLSSINFFVQQQKIAEKLQGEVLELQAQLRSTTLELNQKENLKVQHDQLLFDLERMKGFVASKLGTENYSKILNNKKAIESSQDPD